MPEAIIDPDLPIIDPHHHLWDRRPVMHLIPPPQHPFEHISYRKGHYLLNQLLENVRYTIGDVSRAGVAGFAIRNGNAAAVTLIDTIVFKDESYLGSLGLWAHEMHHIQQYKEWGLSGFAARYAFSWGEVEAEASARAKEFVAWYRERQGLN